MNGKNKFLSAVNSHNCYANNKDSPLLLNFFNSDFCNAAFFSYDAKTQDRSLLKLLDLRPQSELVIPRTEIVKPKFPVIDIHNHLGHLQDMETYLTEMDKAGVWIFVSLDGSPIQRESSLSNNQDRVLFGSDTSPDAQAYRAYYRFLETEDKYIDPSEGYHLQGRWMIYGLYLPDEVLEKVYYKNALKILSRYEIN